MLHGICKVTEITTQVNTCSKVKLLVGVEVERTVNGKMYIQVFQNYT